METLSLSLSQYLFHFPAARKRKTIARHRFSPFFVSFSNWQRSVNLTEERIHTTTRSDFELEPRDFIEKLSFSLSSFYLDELPPR